MTPEIDTSLDTLPASLFAPERWHISLDIETAGTSPHAAVLAIGAVAFRPLSGEIGEEMSIGIDIEDAFRHGCADAATIKWWMRQSEAARCDAVSGDTSLRCGLASLHSLLSRAAVIDGLAALDCARPLDVPIWANGPSFDIVILEHAYYAVFETPAPWSYRAARCVRTIRDVARAVAGYEPPQQEGVRHSALGDAKYQARVVIGAYAALRHGRPA